MIEIRNISKTFNNHNVLNELSLKIDTGQTTVIIGCSGCGKSVLLKHIIGILEPDSGEVLIDGVDISKLKGKQLNNLRLKFGLVFQSAALFDSLTVEENVGFALKEHVLMDKDAIKKRVRECLEMVGLVGVEDLMPQSLSGGMKKRVALARAISVEPKIILYDEPTIDIDPIMAANINNLIRKLHDSLKITSIVVTHNMVSAYSIADKIAMLYEGKIIFEGTPEEIKNTHNPMVRQFVLGEIHGPLTH